MKGRTVQLRQRTPNDGDNRTRRIAMGPGLIDWLDRMCVMHDKLSYWRAINRKRFEMAKDHERATTIKNLLAKPNGIPL